jgi:phosphatidylglycerophosphatase A
LNPPVVAADSISQPKTKRSGKDYLALAIATCGVGYLPLAPGTWGSLVAVFGYLVLHRRWFSQSIISPGADVRSFHIVLLTIVVAVTMVGTWAASRTERVLQIKDPGKVVIDEVAGQLLALLAVPATFWLSGDATTVLAAFILFRIFDIVKPYPARRLEGMHGGVGIMADDLVAGLYAFLGVMLIRVLLN